MEYGSNASWLAVISLDTKENFVVTMPFKKLPKDARHIPCIAIFMFQVLLVCVGITFKL